MDKEFNKLSRVVQIILLLIPFVNWITEIAVRWSAWYHDQKNMPKLVLAIFVSVFGIVFGWIDVIWCLLYNHLVLG